jgi:chromosome segregation ATPase
MSEASDQEGDDPIREHGYALDTINESPAASAAGDPSLTRPYSTPPSPASPFEKRPRSSASSHNLSVSLLEIHAQHETELEARLEASEALVAQLRQRNAEIMNNCKELKRMAQEVSIENAVSAAETERLRDDVERRRAAEDELGTFASLYCERADSVVSELETRLEAQTELRLALSESRAELDAAKHTIVAQHAHLGAVLERLEGANEPQDSRVETIVVNLAAGTAAQQRVVELEKSASATREELARTRSDLAAAEHTIAFQDERYEALLDRLQGDGEPQADPRVEAIFLALLKGVAAQERVIDLERDKSTLGDKLGTTRYERDMLAIQLESAEAALHDVKLQLGDLVEREEKASDDVMRLEAKRTGLQQELEDARRAQQTLGSRCKAADTALATRGKELFDAQSLCAQLKSEVQGAREDIQVAQGTARTSELLQELEHTRSDLSLAQSENDRLERLQQNELAQSAILSEQLKVTRDELEEAHLEITSLQETCSILNVEHEAVS